MRILLADDHAIMLDALKALLMGVAGIDVVGMALTGLEALELTLRLRPDLVVMDISMPDLNGVDAARRIIREVPGTKVLCLSAHSDRHSVISMLKAGAAGYVVKWSAAKELLRAIERIQSNQTYVSPEITGVVVEALQSGTYDLPADLLTDRERQVLQLVAEGKTSKEIASRLQIAPPTVETHRRAIMNKLELRSIAELTKYAIRQHLTSVDK